MATARLELDLDVGEPEQSSMPPEEVSDEGLEDARHGKEQAEGGLPSSCWRGGSAAENQAREVEMRSKALVLSVERDVELRGRMASDLVS
jgi:hypothetical protein